MACWGFGDAGGVGGIIEYGLDGFGGRIGWSGKEGSRFAQRRAVRRACVSARGKGTTPHSTVSI